MRNDCTTYCPIHIRRARHTCHTPSLFVRLCIESPGDASTKFTFTVAVYNQYCLHFLTIDFPWSSKLLATSPAFVRSHEPSDFSIFLDASCAGASSTD
jgi:hypothetical protein